jgi:hypothetical protein
LCAGRRAPAPPLEPTGRFPNLRQTKGPGADARPL